MLLSTWNTRICIPFTAPFHAGKSLVFPEVCMGVLELDDFHEITMVFEISHLLSPLSCHCSLHHPHELTNLLLIHNILFLSRAGASTVVMHCKKYSWDLLEEWGTVFMVQPTHQSQVIVYQSPTTGNLSWFSVFKGLDPSPTIRFFYWCSLFRKGAWALQT